MRPVFADASEHLNWLSAELGTDYRDFIWLLRHRDQDATNHARARAWPAFGYLLARLREPEIAPARKPATILQFIRRAAACLM